MQLLTGHGLFYFYLYRIDKVETPVCPYCKVGEDTTEHTISICSQWDNERSKLQEEIDLDLNLNRIVKKILESEDNWQVFHTFAEEIMLQKEEDERIRKRARLSQNP